ncbi:MAG: redoxin domain-containing protein [Planctomycetota bacterium]
MKRLVSRSLISTMAAIAGIALAPAAFAQDKATPATKPTEVKSTKTTEPETKVKAKKLTLGDDAPALKVEKFVKGEEIKKFEKGHVYVVEFWATWCGPCIAGMPHLSEVQEKFKDKKVHVIGVDVWERPYSADTFDKVSKFVETQGDRMKYTVAYDGESKTMDTAYMAAAGKNGIPCAFIVNGDGKIAYIGHPGQAAFEDTIQQIVDGKFDMKSAAEKASKSAENEQKTAAINKKIGELVRADKWDEAFVEMDKLVAIDPEMVVQVGMTKFNHYMDVKKSTEAYKVATDLIEGKGKDNAQLLNAIAWTIVDPEKSVEKPDLDVAMKAAARAVEVTKSKDAAVLDTLARVYWLKKDKAKAVEIQTKAVAICKDDQMKEELEERLGEYKGEKNTKSDKDEMDKK